MNKKGISLIVLATTIVVLAILVGMVVTGTSLSLTNSRKQTLANELVQLEDALATANAIGSEMPVKEDSIEYTKESLVALIKEEYKSSLSEEIDDNGDSSDKFKVISMEKAGASTSSKGNAKETGADIFVYATKSLNVYYVLGVHAGGESYYSLTEKLSDIVKIESNTSVDTVLPEIQVTVAKNYKVNVLETAESNKLTLRLETPEGFNGKVELKVTDGSVKYIDITNKIEGNNYVYKVGGESSLTSAVVNASKNMLAIRFTEDLGLPTEKKTEVPVNVAYMDITPPSNPIKVKSISAGVNNILEVKSIDTNIAYFIYEFKTKKDSKGSSINVYETNAETEEQQIAALKAKGLKSEDGILKLPKYIESVLVLAVDKAGNSSSIATLSVDSNLIINEL